MTSTIIHFGFDDCARVEVLKRAGFEVRDCGVSMLLFRQMLGKPHDAVSVTDSPGVCNDELMRMLRDEKPVILFESAECWLDATRFDLAIPPLTSPELWLEGIDAMIRETKGNCERAREVQNASAAIRGASAETRSKFRAERERSIQIRRQCKASGQ